MGARWSACASPVLTLHVKLVPILPILLSLSPSTLIPFPLLCFLNWGSPCRCKSTREWTIYNDARHHACQLKLGSATVVRADGSGCVAEPKCWALQFGRRCSPSCLSTHPRLGNRRAVRRLGLRGPTNELGRAPWHNSLAQ